MKLIISYWFEWNSNLVYEIVPRHIILWGNSCHCFIQIISRDSRQCNTHCGSNLAWVTGPPFVVQHVAVNIRLLTHYICRRCWNCFAYTCFISEQHWWWIPPAIKWHCVVSQLLQSNYNMIWLTMCEHNYCLLFYEPWQWACYRQRLGIRVCSTVCVTESEQHFEHL